MALVATDGKAKAPRIGSNLAHDFLKKSLLFKMSSFIVYLITPMNVAYAKTNSDVVIPNIKHGWFALIIYYFNSRFRCSLDRRRLVNSIIRLYKMVGLCKSFSGRIIVVNVVFDIPGTIFLPA